MRNVGVDGTRLIGDIAFVKLIYEMEQQLTLRALRSVPLSKWLGPWPVPTVRQRGNAARSQ
jgi:hypothetical protein